MIDIRRESFKSNLYKNEPSIHDRGLRDRGAASLQLPYGHGFNLSFNNLVLSWPKVELTHQILINFKYISCKLLIQ